jgi:lysozyme family protein
LVEEFVKLNKESSFKESQKIVSLAEGGYSDDRKDTGNWVDIGDKLLKRFIGSNMEYRHLY